MTATIIKFPARKPTLEDLSGFDLCKRINAQIERKPVYTHAVLEMECDKAKELAYSTAVSFLDFHLDMIKNHYAGSEKESTANFLVAYLQRTARKEMLDML